MVISISGSDRKHIQYIDKLSVDRLIDTDSFVERHIDDLVILHSDHHVALPVLQRLYGCHSQAAGQDAVIGCRDTASL